MKILDKNFDAILITGPTASGKSALALCMARECKGVVINADSMQVYDTLRMLTARPSPSEMDGIAHLLYGHVPASRLYSTGQWLREIGSVLQEMREKALLPVIVGGTGLYFKALTGGLSNMPTISADLRERLRNRLVKEGANALHAELVVRDPVMGKTLMPSDGQRIVRALEILEETERSIRDFQQAVGPMIVDPTRARKIVLLPERSLLNQRIIHRFETIMESGAVDEVRALLALGLAEDATAMKAIGVSQIAGMLAGRMSRAEAIEASAAATRQYAKRQMTWFRNQMGDDWEFNSR